MILATNTLIHNKNVLWAKRQDHRGAQGKALQKDS
jgi:hypothetical protein